MGAFVVPMEAFILQLICCSVMAGLIWTIQILHYPAFAFIHEGEFTRFHERHSRSITFIVGPVMLVEVLTAVVLNFRFPFSKVLWANSFLILLTWGCTFFLSVPLHGMLSKNRDLKVIGRLVSTNWYRTALWSVRVILLLYIFFNILKENYVHIVK
jgi:uncharacterized membrane protein